MTPEFLQALGKIGAAFTTNKQLRHPYTVEQHDLMWHVLGEEHFRAELAERHRWIEQHRTASFAFDTLPNGAGRVYLFAAPDDAFHFKLRFGSRVFPRADR